MTLQRVKIIGEEMARRILLYSTHNFGQEKYSRIKGNLSLEICQEKISEGIQKCFVPAFLQKAYGESQTWKNGDKKTLSYKKWNHDEDTLCVTFRIRPGAFSASFTLDKVDIVAKTE